MLVLPGAAGCSGADSDADAPKSTVRELSLTEQNELSAMRQATGSRIRWRQENLPKLLAWFGSDNPEKWRRARAELLSNPNTPSRRTDKNGAAVKEHILARLDAGDWDSEASRQWLVLEGRVYAALAGFNSDRRADWSQARERLCSLGRTDDEKLLLAQRCAFELVLRLLNVPDSEEMTMEKARPTVSGSRNGQTFRTEGWIEQDAQRRQNEPLRNRAVEQDHGLWAMEELELIGKPAVGPIMLGTYLSYQGAGGTEGVRLLDLLFHTLARLGELAVPALLADLKNSCALEDKYFAFQRVRRLVRTLGEIYGAAMDGHRPAWQAHAQHIPAVIAGLADVLAFDPQGDTRQYTIRVYVIEAYAKIGDAAACPILLNLWETAGLDDVDLRGTIIKCLRWLTHKNLSSLEEWKRQIRG